MRVQGLETGWGKRQGAGCCEAGRLPEVRSCGRELDALGPPPVTGEGGDPGVRRLPRRHAVGGFMRRGSEPEDQDVSQAILFPAAGNEGGVLAL